MKHVAYTDFFARRWRGEVPLAVLFWRDMIVVGSLVNLAASVLTLALVLLDAPLAIALAVHFAPLPYNFFLFAALWRLPRRPVLVSVGAGLWLAAASLL